MTPIRVAQIIGKLVAGGVESVVFNYYRNIDHTKIQFDFYYDADSTIEPPEDLIAMGARFIKIPPYQRLFSYTRALENNFRENHYTIVHVHLNSLSVFPLFAAWRAGVPVRILHNHSTSVRKEWKRNIMKSILKPLCPIFATDYCACSIHAAEWMYGKNKVQEGKVTIWKNAIDVKRFLYNKETRNAVRKELGIEGKFVVGHIGRFVVTKNHAFLNDIFANVYRKDPNSVLILVGEGPLMDDIQRKVSIMNLKRYVYFLGIRSDVHRLYQAMDVFLFPSLYEGLGMVAIEAQAAGLPVVMSENVPQEAVIIPLNKRLSLHDDLETWAKNVINSFDIQREHTSDILTDAGYDIQDAAGQLESYYQNLILSEVY